MARFHLLPLTIVLALVFARHALCSDSPSPAPAHTADAPSSPSPSPTASISSPPAPPPSDLSPSSSPTPAPSPANSTSSLPTHSHAPAPGVAGISHAGVADDKAEPESSDGMSAGKKAGIAVGVIACAGFVVFGTMLFKKRQQNIRRSQYGSAARREFL